MKPNNLTIWRFTRAPSASARPPGSTASRRARSEISSSSASRTKLATIELPP